jgi:hypothetical protein
MALYLRWINRESRKVEMIVDTCCASKPRWAAVTFQPEETESAMCVKYYKKLPKDAEKSPSKETKVLESLVRVWLETNSC